MAKIATCPHCAEPMGLPDSLSAGQRLECPACKATFPVAEASEKMLLTARILEPEKPDISLIDSSQAESPANDSPSEQLERVSASQSWEERLKNALAKPSLDESKPPIEKTEQTPSETGYAVEGQALEKHAPKFEFEFEAPVPERTTQEKPTKTLADFAAAADIPALDLDPPTVDQTEAPDVSADDVSVGDVSVGDVFTDRVSDEGEMTVVPTLPSDLNRPSFTPKVTALIAGPVIGTVLGLYGLLWLQGAKADYVGLSRVLPDSLLPADFGEGRENLAQFASKDAVAPENTPVAEPSKAMPSAEPQRIKRDDSVLTASADQQMISSLAAASTVNANDFSELVDAAEVALTELMVGDLTTPESVRRKGQAYMALCRLAEHYQFAKQPGLAPTIQAKARRAAQVFRQAAAELGTRDDLVHISSRWWSYDQRPSDGIFLLGSVQKVESLAAGTIYWLAVADQSATDAIPVLLSDSRFQPGDEIGVVGRVVSQPMNLPIGLSARQMVEAAYGYPLNGSL